MNKSTASTIAVVLAAVLLFGGCTQPTATDPAATDPAAPAQAVAQPGIKVTAAQPETGTLELTTAFVGSVQPEQVVSVMPQMVGTVTKVHVVPGQAVKKGDLLMTLDDKDLRLSFAQAEATYNSLITQADQMTGYQFQNSLNQADSAFDGAFEAYENAQYSMSEAEDALDEASAALKEAPEDAALQAAYAKAQAAYEIADIKLTSSRKAYNNAKNSYNTMKVDGEEQITASADATRKTAEANLAAAKSGLEKTKLYAPVDGVVESVSVSELNMVTNSAPAFVISNKAALMVSFNVPSSSIAAMQLGMKVAIEKGQTVYSGTISEVNTMVNQQTGLFTVKATLDESSPELLTGVMVKVTAPTKRAENAILLSQDSVYYDEGKAYIYLAADGYAKKVYIDTGISTPEQVEVTGGLASSDTVITSWHPNLMDGAKIELGA